MERDYIKFLGIPVDKVDMNEALSRFDDFINSEGLSVIVTPNSEIVSAASKDEALKEVISNADLVIPDGIGLVKAAKMIGSPLKERVTGIDFTYNALKRMAGKHSVYFLGSKPGIAAKAAENLAKEMEGLKVAGTHDGYFKPEEEMSVVEEINNSGADFLCVALGFPKQELFLMNHKKDLKAKVGIGIGGSMDVWSGTLDRAPQFYIDHGLEWLYRTLQEPSRIKRLAKTPGFLIKVRFGNKEE